MAIKEIGQSATEVGFQADPGLIKNADGETVIAVTADEKVGIGTTDPGSTLEVKDGHITATDADVAHGVTNVAATNAYGDFGPIHATYGGLMINGISDQESADARSLALRGISNDSHTDTVPLVEIIGAKRSGASVQALADAETVLTVANHTSTKLSVMGSGNTGIGTASPDRKLEILDASNPQLRLTHTDNTEYVEFQSLSTGDAAVVMTDSELFVRSLDGISTLQIQNATTGHTPGFVNGMTVGCVGVTGYVWMRDGTSTLSIGAGGSGGITLDADNNIAVLEGSFQLKAEIAAPSAPGSGDGGIFYVKSDGIPYFISDTTAETSLVGGGGGGTTTTGGTLITADPAPAVAGTMYLCNAASAFNVTLPTAAAAGNGGTIDVCKASGANNITVLRAGSDTINGATSQVVSVLYGNVTLISDGGTKWYIR